MRPALYVLLGVLLVPTVGLVGDIVTDGKFKSTLPSGAPLEVESTAMVANLNADQVDGIEGTDIYTKAEIDALLAAVVAEFGRTRYYLTTAVHDGADASAACDSGFHMASVFEIFDPANLEYAHDLIAAQKLADSGNGPPTGVGGWVRTGHVSSNIQGIAGAGNCNAYTSNESTHDGTVIQLPVEWENPDHLGLWQGIWSPTAWDCEALWRVWCVED